MSTLKKAGEKPVPITRNSLTLADVWWCYQHRVNALGRCR